VPDDLPEEVQVALSYQAEMRMELIEANVASVPFSLLLGLWEVRHGFREVDVARGIERVQGVSYLPGDNGRRRGIARLVSLAAIEGFLLR